VEAHPGDSVAVGRETEEEKRDASAVLEVLSPKGLLEASIPVDPLSTIEIHLPEIRAFVGVMALESNAGRLVHKARAVAVSSTDYVCH
jgi:hypothetical protein